MSMQQVQQLEESPYALIGKSVARVDAREKVTGAAIYTHDLRLPNMIFGKIKRSTHAHAEIISIDTSRAEKLRGVRAILTSRDLPNIRGGILVKDTPVLAIDRVRYVGDPIVALAADTPEIAQEAIDLIDIEYHDLPAIFELEQAMMKNPPVIIHPDFKSYAAKFTGSEAGIPNLHAYFRVRKGNVDEIFKKCDLVVENIFRTNIVQHFHLEPIVSVARVEPNGTITIWESTQAPFMLRNEVSEALQISPDKINVIVPHVGGGYGGKLVSFLAPITVALAMRTHRPVKIAMTRKEVFDSSSVRQPFLVTVKDGVTKDGRILARKVTSCIAGGAYSAGMGVNEVKASVCGVSHYKTDNFWYDAFRVYTNRVPGGPYRGFGAMQVNWAIESQMDILAETLGIDPIDLRLRNLLEEGDRNVIGELTTSAEYQALLLKAKEMIQWGHNRAAEGPWRFGKGISIGHKWSFAPTASSAVVKYSFGGTLLVQTSAVDMGTGAQTVMGQIAGEVMKIPIDRIHVTMPDTNTTPFSDGAFSTRQTFNDGNAVRLASLDLKRHILERAAPILHADMHDLVTMDGTVYSKQNPRRSILIDDLFVRGVGRGGAFVPVREFMGAATWYQASGALRPEDGQCTTDRACAFYDAVAAAAEVGVNIETGQTKVLRLCLSVDPGTVINPTLLQGQVQGAAFMAFSNTLFEELVIDNGVAVNPELADYKIAGSKDAPEIVVSWRGTPFVDGPFGAKGIGEGPMLPTTGAITSAIYNAVGVRPHNLPITSEKVLLALIAKEGKKVK